MLRFAKQDAIGKKSGRKLKNIDVYDSTNLLELNDMEISADTEKNIVNSRFWKTEDSII